MILTHGANSLPGGGGEMTVEARKTYQLTCVGDCWTLAEFVTPVE